MHVIWSYSQPICYGNLPVFARIICECDKKKYGRACCRTGRAMVVCIKFAVTMLLVSVFDDLLFIVTVSMTIPEQCVFNHFLLAFLPLAARMCVRAHTI